MANNNRKAQNKKSVNHTIMNQKKEQNVKEQAAKQPVNNGSAEKSQNNHGFDSSVLWELVKKYKRYIAAGVLFAAMVVILAKCTGPVTDAPKDPAAEEQLAADQREEFQIDAVPEVNTLIGDYYHAYATGNVTALEALARPISDTEKSYIQVFSEYVESYDNITCYTKSGLTDGEYVVSVYLEMKFKDVATVAPGLDFFYLRTDDSGKLYIDNAYSQFNQSNMETSTEADVQALINQFEQAEDVVALQTEVQQKYEKAITDDADLNKMANETIPNTIAEWVQSLTKAEETSEDTQQENPQETTDQKQEDQTNTEKPEETDTNKDTSENSDGKAKTAYAMDGINLRKGPSTDKSIVTQIPLGDKLKIYPDTEKDGWVKASYDGHKGYVKRELVTTKRSKVPEVSTQEENEPATALPVGKKITLSDSVNVRVSMSETADRVGLAYQGDTVEVIQSYAEGWTKVKWNGETGYIKTDLIK